MTIYFWLFEQAGAKVVSEPPITISAGSPVSRDVPVTIHAPTFNALTESHNFTCHKLCGICQTRIDVDLWRRIKPHGDGTCKGIGMCWECGAEPSEKHKNDCSGSALTAGYHPTLPQTNDMRRHARDMATKMADEFKKSGCLRLPTTEYAWNIELSKDGAELATDIGEYRICFEGCTIDGTVTHKPLCQNHWSNPITGICPDCGKP